MIVWTHHTVEDIDSRLSLDSLWPVWMAQLLKAAVGADPDNWRQTDAKTASTFLKHFYVSDDVAAGTFDPQKVSNDLVLDVDNIQISNFKQQVGGSVTHPGNMALQLVKTCVPGIPCSLSLSTRHDRTWSLTPVAHTPRK